MGDIEFGRPDVGSDATELDVGDTTLVEPVVRCDLGIFVAAQSTSLDDSNVLVGEVFGGGHLETFDLALREEETRRRH